VRFAYCEVTNHQGGKSLFQLSNCYDLMVEFEECTNARERENIDSGVMYEDMILSLEGGNCVQKQLFSRKNT